MIFSVQRFIEDYFERRHLSDIDQYAVKLANAFAPDIHTADTKMLTAFSRIRTVFFRNNPNLKRKVFESQLLKLLRSRFKKKVQLPQFPGGIAVEKRTIFRRSRVTIGSIISGFRHAVEARAIDVFWNSRKKNHLAQRPEKVGQALFATFARGVLQNRGVVFREMASGIGFVDIAIILGSAIHLIEMKLIRKQVLGVSQLNTYMRTENRKRGWLVFFDARPAAKRQQIPALIAVPEGKIAVVGIDINPTPPSRQHSF